MLDFNMGHYFRYTHEFVIIGTRGRVTKHVKNKSQRGVFFTPALSHHSAKPEILQDKLELIFPDLDKRVEFFARRERSNWICAGNELPSTANEDILQTIERLKLC
jgi:N6-adenosine-specific RNA methylase IME4